MPKNHTWRIKRVYFDQLASGRKELEIRVGYDWVKKVEAGDTITFENYGANCFAVKRVAVYDSFEEMLETEGAGRVLPGMSAKAALRALREIYPERKEALGVYVFELQPKKRRSKAAKR